jgi:hypothetical protein
MTMLLLSVVLFNLNNSSISMVYGDKGNNNNHNDNNNKVKNHSLINSISDQVVNSNVGTNKEQVQQVLQQIQTQIALTSGQDKATKAINQINSIIDLNPNGPLSQSLLSLAKQQAAGNTDVVVKAAAQIAGKVSSGGDDLGQPSAAQDLAQSSSEVQDLGQSLSEQAGTSSSSSSSPSPSLSSLSSQVLSSSAGTTTSNKSSQQQQQQQSSQLLVQQQQQKTPIQPTNNNPSISSSQFVSNTPQQSVTSPQSVVDKPPVANADHPGPDQIVNESSLVTLDGSASYDPDGKPLTYLWTQTAGRSVTLSNPTSAITTFTAPPPVSTNTAGLTFELTVKDTVGLTDSDTVHITVNHVTQPPPPVNRPPIANAGPDQTVASASVRVTLDGSASTDPDRDPITFTWTQTAGTPVTLSGTDTANPTFTAPSVTAQTTLTFQLTVQDDHGASSTATVNIFVNPSTNQHPIASAGPDQTVNEGSVTLDGSASTDPDGNPLTYEWTQLPGTPLVQINNHDQAIASFTAPNVSTTTVMFFTLTVTDPGGLTDSATVKVTVNHVTPPPPVDNGTDPFGIKKIYKTKQGGEEWFMNMNNPLSDPRLFTRTDQSQFSKNPDGSWKVGSTNNNQGRFHIYTSSGYHQNLITTYNEAQLAAKGYMQSPNDWKNVEMTGYVKLNAYNAVDHAFVWYNRGGHHSTSFSCEGTAYKGNINYVGQTRFQKEQWHPSYFTTSWKNTALAPDPRGMWFGFKYIVYNFEQNGKPTVKMENWLDAKADGNWVKIDENVDSGGWGTTAGQCGGRPDQLITWGGPVATFRFDGTTDLDFKNLSIREIQPPQ